MHNRQWLLAARPLAQVGPGDFAFRETETSPSPGGKGQVLLQIELVLCAPTIRNWISGNTSSYYPTVEIGSPVMAPAVGRVVASDNSRFPVGTRLAGTGSWQDYQWVDPGRGYTIIPDGMSSVDALGVFGMNALTAYFGLLEVGRVQPGEVLLVSGAAGSVGSVAAQIGRIKGARVIGLCGGADKVRWLKQECGISEVIDYKADDPLGCLDALCPDGIDVYFDNVGGTLLRDVVARMRRHGRVVLCGQIATYDGAASDASLDMMRIIYGSFRLQGFLAIDYAASFDDAVGELSKWVEGGMLAHREDVRDGFHLLPETFSALFTGQNSGTLIARLSDHDGNLL